MIIACGKISQKCFAQLQYCIKLFLQNYIMGVMINTFTKFCRKCFCRIRTLCQQLEHVFISAKIIRPAFSKIWWVKRHTYTANLFHVFWVILPLISQCMAMFSADLFADVCNIQSY